MHRRTVLSFLLGGVVGGSGVALYGPDNSRERISRLIEGQPVDEEPPVEYMLGGPFKRIRYKQDGTVELYFEQFHDADEFYIKYHQDSDMGDLFYSNVAPETGTTEPVVFDLISQIQATGVEYPDRRFDLVAVKGTIPESAVISADAVTEKIHTATLRIPTAFELSP